MSAFFPVDDFLTFLRNQGFSFCPSVALQLRRLLDHSKDTRSDQENVVATFLAQNQAEVSQFKALLCDFHANNLPIRDQIFISYSPTDRDYLDRLQVHLKPRVRQRNIAVWDNTEITPGDERNKKIADAIDRARVAVLLVSPDYLASDFIAARELPLLVSSASSGGLTVIWILIRPCAYYDSDIISYEPAYPPTQPLSGLSQLERELALELISDQILSLYNSYNGALLRHSQKTEKWQASRPIPQTRTRYVSIETNSRRTAKRIVIQFMCFALATWVLIFSLIPYIQVQRAINQNNLPKPKNELIKLLKARAEMAVSQMSKRESTLLERYCRSNSCEQGNSAANKASIVLFSQEAKRGFMTLHERHIQAIQNEQYFLAHELVGQMHQIIFNHHRGMRISEFSADDFPVLLNSNAETDEQNIGSSLRYADLLLLNYFSARIPSYRPRIYELITGLAHVAARNGDDTVFDLLFYVHSGELFDIYPGEFPDKVVSINPERLRQAMRIWPQQVACTSICSLTAGHQLEWLQRDCATKELHLFDQNCRPPYSRHYHVGKN